ADVWMHEPRSRLRFAPKALGDFGVARQVRVKHLDDDLSGELHLLGHEHVRHAAAAQSPEHAISIARGAAKTRDLVIRALERNSIELGQGLAAAQANGLRRPVPRSALRTEHRQPPNCMRTKS